MTREAHAARIAETAGFDVIRSDILATRTTEHVEHACVGHARHTRCAPWLGWLGRRVLFA